MNTQHGEPEHVATSESGSVRDQAGNGGPLSDADYRSLAEFRRLLRRFLSFSEDAAKTHGIHPAQHQLMLAIRGCGPDRAPSTSELADILGLKLHSAGELANRAIENGLVERHGDPTDGRRSLLSLTSEAHATLDSLSVLHRSELAEFRTKLDSIFDGPQTAENKSKDVGGDPACWTDQFPEY